MSLKHFERMGWWFGLSLGNQMILASGGIRDLHLVIHVWLRRVSRGSGFNLFYIKGILRWSVGWAWSNGGCNGVWGRGRRRRISSNFCIWQVLVDESCVEWLTLCIGRNTNNWQGNTGLIIRWCKQVVGWSIGRVDLFFYDGGVLIVSLNLVIEVLSIEVVFILVNEVDWHFFGGFGENVTFFLVIEGEVVKGWEWIVWPFWVSI